MTASYSNFNRPCCNASIAMLTNVGGGDGSRGGGVHPSQWDFHCDGFSLRNGKECSDGIKAPHEHTTNSDVRLTENPVDVRISVTYNKNLHRLSLGPGKKFTKTISVGRDPVFSHTFFQLRVRSG